MSEEKTFSEWLTYLDELRFKKIFGVTRSEFKDFMATPFKIILQ